ncbi:type II secretion system protein N [Aliikangiella sp. IMCC44632]
MIKKIVVLSLCFIVFLVYLIPASLFENHIPARQGLSISGLSGTIWRGEVRETRFNTTSVSETSFSLSVFSLFLGALSVDLEIPQGDVTGELNVTLPLSANKPLQLKDASLKLRAEQLNPIIGIRDVSVGGQISTDTLEAKVLAKKLLSLNGSGRWNNASVNYAGQNWELGDFLFSAKTDEANKLIEITILNSKNKLDLQGKATINSAGMFEFIGSISTSTEQSIYNAMTLFNNGKPAAGRLPIKFKQKIF